MAGIPRHNRPSGSPPLDAEPGRRDSSRPTFGPPDLHPADPGPSPDEVTTTPPQAELSRVLRELLGGLPIGSATRSGDPTTPTDRVRQYTPLGSDPSSESAGRGETGTSDGAGSAAVDAGPSFFDARSSFPSDTSRESTRQGLGTDPTDATLVALPSAPRAIAEDRAVPRLPEDRGLIGQGNTDTRSEGPVGERRGLTTESSASLGPSSTEVAGDDRGTISRAGIAVSGDLIAAAAPPTTAPSFASPFPTVSGRDDDRGVALGSTPSAVAIGGLIGPRDDPAEGPERRPMAASDWVAPFIGGGTASSDPSGPDMARTNTLLEQILDALRRQSQPPFLASARAVYPER